MDSSCGNDRVLHRRSPSSTPRIAHQTRVFDGRSLIESNNVEAILSHGQRTGTEASLLRLGCHLDTKSEFANRHCRHSCVFKAVKRNTSPFNPYEHRGIDKRIHCEASSPR